MKKKIGITAAVILGILAVCYIGFAVFFQSHFCFGTTIDGIKVGGCSTVKVEQLIEEEIGGYELTLVERLRMAGDSVWKECTGTGKNGCL